MFIKKCNLQNNSFFYYNDLDGLITTDSINTKFYNSNPFPNYEDGDNISKLIDKNNNNDFSFSLINSINYEQNHTDNIKVLEVGCGTGQLSNLISKLTNCDYYGTDITEGSLKIASEFAYSNEIDNINYYMMDIFNPYFKENSFDVVISNGVLHHTSDPYLAFQNCVKLLKPGGILLVGLYNKIGRLKNSLIKYLYKITKLKFFFNLDYVYRNINNKSKKNAWLMDQYFHPQEKRYSYGDLFKWYESNKVEPLRFIPDIRDNSIKFENIFSKSKEFSKTFNLLNEIDMFLFNKEGGLYILIGKKNQE